MIIKDEFEVFSMASSDVAAVKAMLNEVATHAYSLAMGLQNVAPAQAQSQAQPAKSVQYLLDTAAQFAQTSGAIDLAFPNG